MSFERICPERIFGILPYVHSSLLLNHTAPHRFQGPKVWNSLELDIKSTSFRKFKENLKKEFLYKY